MSKPVLQVMAHKLSYLLRDKEVAVIENIRCGDGTFIIEGVIGKEGHFAIPATQIDIRTLLDAANSITIRTFEEQDVVGSDVTSRKKAAPAATLVRELKPEEPRAAEDKPTEKRWQPPTKPVPTDRKKLSKPGEQDLFLQFTRVNTDPYKGRKKLTAAEQKAKEAVLDRNEIARSYILAGDRAMVRDWITFLKS